MASAQILVVEDESIVAKDIQETLENLGYAVPVVVSSGEEAIRRAAEIHPDLALMDIVLKGNMDGVAAAQQIHDRYNIPVVYLTAYADDATVNRAKTTEPFGYILKPYQEKELHSTIHLALYKSQMEKKLRESQEWLSTTLKSIGDAIVATDKRGRVMFMNPIAQSLTGWREEEAVGKSLRGLFRFVDDGTEQGIENPVYRIILEGAVVSLKDHVALLGRNGTKIPIEACASPIRDASGQVFGAVLVFRDVTEHKRAETQIQLGLRRLATLREMDLAVGSTLDLRAVLDLILEQIDQMLPSFAVTAIRLFNQGTGELELVACRNLNREEWRSARGLAHTVVEARAPLFVRDVQTDPRTRNQEFFRKHGLVSYLGFPLVAKEQVLGTLCLYVKKGHECSDEEIKFLSTVAHRAALAIYNSRLFEQTKRQAEELEKASKVKDDFLSFVSHEVRTPLNAIMGYTEMVKSKMAPNPDQALGKVLKYSGDLLTMMDSILDATKIEAGAVTVVSREIHLRDLLDEIRSAYNVPLEKDVTVVWDYPSELPAMKTDGIKLRHILQNLINNAIKYTERGSVTVSVRLLPVTDSPAHRFGEPGNRGIGAVEFKVADTGIGIPDEKLATIFEKFQQVESWKTKTHSGVGLGLYIVKTFVTLLGGKIEVESKSGKGSTFTVLIPYQT